MIAYLAFPEVCGSNLVIAKRDKFEFYLNCKESDGSGGG